MAKSRLFIASLLLICLVSFAGRPAVALTEAGEAYVAPTYNELIQTIMLLGGLDVQKPKVLDEYIKLMYCDLYKENYKDDFGWNAIEKQILAKITSKREYSRSLYQLVGAVQLGKYDIARQAFPLVGGTAFQNVGSMALNSSGPRTGCIKGDEGWKKAFPDKIDLVLPEPFSLTSYKIPQADAVKMLDRMEKLKITDRKLYIRFRFRVQSVVAADPYHHYRSDNLHLGGEITDIDLFYDPDMTEWISDVSLKATPPPILPQ